ncbi:hypothetical protein EKK58_12880 [Candidatus Dependentiae bacterium]|nr:MAG: hypothetical protein EKK58_12880 [Candidatus Dependentiae bacterium]
MVGILNPNTVEISLDNTLLPPRNTGRGLAKKPSTGTISEVTWLAGQIRIDGANFFALATEPVILDFAFDSADRGQVVYKLPDDSTYIRFYDPIIPGYNTLPLGNVTDPAICNDFELLGSNTVLVYLVNNLVNYRLQSDRYQTEYQLHTTPLSVIRRFGVQTSTNSLAVLKTFP